MCDCFHLAFPNWHAASSGTGAGRRLRAPEPGAEDDSTCDEPPQFTEGERPRPQGSSPVEEYPETEKYTDRECEAEHYPHHKSGTGKKTKKSGLGSMFEKRSTPKMSKLQEVPSPESGVIVKTAKDGCAEGLVYGGGGKEGIFIKEVVPESPASKSLKLKEGDQILSATVYFDNVSYEDAIQILEHAQAYKVKLCLKRKPDITETEPAIESDVIPEEDVYAPEMREQGKTKRRGDARISWPKFPSFGKGRKSRFTRSHSSSEADEQKRLELSPTTSDTESPIKSQDALKGKKKHKIKLNVLKKRGRISSSEDQDTDATSAQILSPECLESPSGETPQVYVTENLKVVEDLRHAQNDEILTEPQSVQHKVELITIDSTLKTEDLTVALAGQESPSGIKSPDGKKKKKERSELKIKILGKDKSQKDAKRKSSPKRLKTLGASIEIADQSGTEKSDVVPSIVAVDANTQIISSESSRVITAKSVTTPMEMSVPKVEIEISDVAMIQKSPQKGEEKRKKGKEVQQKQDTKTGPTFKLPKIGFSDIATEENISKMNINVDEFTTKIEQLKIEGPEVRDDPYERLSKSSLSITKLPKREDIEIPGMEDMSVRTTVKGIKEPKAVFTGHYEDIQAETVQLSIDVDSVKEAVSKLPGFKLPKVDTSGVPIPEEITVIDANAQRISVKTPTKTKYDAHLSRFDITASTEISKTTVKLPKITQADLTPEELLVETMVDLKKTEKQYKPEPKHGDKEVYKREHIIIPGKESVHEVAMLQTQETQGKDGITSKYEAAATMKSKKSKATMKSFGIAKPDISIPDIGIYLPKENISEQKADNVKGERTIFLQEVDISKTETRNEIEGVVSDVKIPEIDGIEYIDSADGSPAKRDVDIRLTGFGVNLDALSPKADISFPEISCEVKDVEAEEHTFKLPKVGAVAPNISVNVPHAGKDINIDGAEIKTLEREGKGGKFKMPDIGISMPKVKGHKIDLSPSKKDVDITLPEAKAEVDATLGNVDISIPEQKLEVVKPELETQPWKAEGELDGQGGKFKMPKFGIKMPKIKKFEYDLSNVTLPEANAEVKLSEAPNIDTSLGKAEDLIPVAKVVVKKPEGKIKPLPTDVELEGGKIEMPKFGITMPKVKGPEINFGLSKKHGDVTLPEVPEVELKEPSAQVDIKAPEIKVAAKGTDGSPIKFKMPTFKRPKFGIGTQNSSVEVPDKDQDVKIDGADIHIPDEGYAVHIAAPSIDIEGSSIDMKTTGSEHDVKGSKFKMPHFGFSIPKVKGPKIDLGQSKKDIDVKLIKETKADFKLPEVDLRKVDVSVPDAKMEIKKPEMEMQSLQTGGELVGQGQKLKIPKFGIEIPKVKGPEFDLSLSKIDDVTQPQTKAAFLIPQAEAEVEKAELEIKPLQTDVERQGSKFKMPKFEMSMPKVKGPEFHPGLLKKDVDVTLPEAKTDVKLPDVELKETSAKVEIKAPVIQVVAKDTEGSPSKLKMPNFSFSTPKVKGPDMDLSVSKKDTDITSPGTKAEIQLPAAPKIDASIGKAEVLITDAKVEIKKPEVKIKPLQTGIELEGHSGQFQMPKFGISRPKVKGPEIDFSLSKKDVDITLPASAEVNVPDVEFKEPSAKVEIKAPEIEVHSSSVKGSPSKLKLPSFKFPIFGATTANVSTEVPDVGKEIKIDGADVHISSQSDVEVPEVKAEVHLPEVEVKKPSGGIVIEQQPGVEVEAKLKKPRFSLPRFSFSKASVKAPEVDPSLQDVNVAIPADRVEIKGGGVDMKLPECEVEVDGQGSKFKIPKFGISMPKVKGPDIDLSLTKKDVDVTFPEAKVEVQLPDVKIKQPSARVEITAPEIEAQAGSVEGSPTKFKMPTFTLPKFGAATPKVSVEVPAVDKDIAIDGAKVYVTAHSIDTEGLSADLKAKGSELEESGSKFKMPKFGISMPKVKGPEIDLSLSRKDVDVTLPEAKAEVQLPDVQVKQPSARVEITAPEIEAQAGSVEGSSSKFKMPTFTLPKFGAATPKVSVEVPDVDRGIQIDGAKVDVTAPSIDTEGLSADVKAKGSEHEGSEGKFKMPKFGISMPKVKGTEIDLSSSKKDVEITLPKAQAEIKLPNVEVKPEVEIKAPETKALTKDKEGSPLKFKMPTLKLPKFGISTPSATIEVPDIDGDIKLDGSDIKIPEEVLAVNITAPSIDIGGPSMDIKTTGTQHEGKGSKFKLQSLGFSGPQVKQPDIDLSLSKKDVDVTLPEVKADVSLPDVGLKEPSAEVEIKGPQIKVATKNTEGSPSRFKMPTFKFPKFRGSTPSATVEVPDVDIDVKSDGSDNKIPEEVLAVHITAPSIDTEGPSVDIKTTGTEHEGKGSKFKLPSLGFSGPQVKHPDIDLSLSKKYVDVTLPEVKADVKLSDVGLKEPSAEVEIKGPQIKVATKNTEGSPSRFKMPTFKFPKFGGSTPSATVEVPDVDIDVKSDGSDNKIPEEVLAVHITAPSIDTEGPSVDIKTTGTEHEGKGSKFKMPSLGFSGPQVKQPDIDLSLSKKYVDVTLPEAKAEVKLPDIKLKEPSAEVEIKAPESNIVTKGTEGSPTKFKMPTFKFPKFGISTPSATVEMPDTEKDVKINEADIKIAEEVLAVHIAAPNIDSEGPSVDIKTTGTEHEGKGSKFKLPRLSFSGPQVKQPDIDLSLSKKDVDVTLPEVKADVKLPDVGLKEPSAEVEIKAPEIRIATKNTEGSPSRFKMPTFKFPKFGGSTQSATVEVPDMDSDVKIDGSDIKIPEEVLEVYIAAPNIDSKGPSIDIQTTGTEHEGKESKFKLPSLSFSGPQVKQPDIDLSLSKKGEDVTLPEVKAEVKLPEVEIREPVDSISVSQSTMIEGDTKMTKTSWTLPRFSFSKAGVKSPEADVNLDVPKVDVTLSGNKTDVNVPDIDIKESSGLSIEGTPATDLDAKLKKPRFSLPKFSFSKQISKESNVDVSLPDIEVSLPEVNVEVTQPEVELKPPAVDVELEGQERKFKMPKFGISMPKVKGPDIDLSLTKKDVDVTFPEAKVEVQLPDVKIKQPSARVEITAPEIEAQAGNVEGSPTKFKMPTFTLPKFGAATPKVSVEVPAVDKDIAIDGAKVDVTAHSIDTEGLSVDLKAKGSELEESGSKFKMPKFGISMPKVKGPEIDLSLSKKDVEVTLPEVKAEVQLPDVKVKQPSARVEIKAPEIEAKAGSVEGSPSKFKMPTFTLPKFGAATPKVSVEGPHVDKYIKIDGDKVDVTAPSIDTEGLSVDVEARGSEFEESGSKFKMPKFGISMPKVTGPEIDLSLSKKEEVIVTLPEAKAEVKLPNVEVKEPEGAISVPAAPTVEVETKLKRSNWTFPKFSFSRTGGKADDDVNLETPKVDFTSAEAKAEFQEPSGAISMEEPHAAELDANLKKTKFSLPRFSFSKSSVREPEVSAELPHADVSIPGGEVIVRQPEMKMKAPGVKAEVKLPDIDVKDSSASVEIKASETEVGGSPLKFKMPTLKTPKFASYGVTIEAPDADQVSKTDGAKLKEDVTVNIQGPSVNIKTDVSKAAITDSETPKTETDSMVLGSPSKFKLPSFKMPRLSFSRSNLEDEHIPVDTECKEEQMEKEVEPKGDSTSPKVTLTSFGDILKNFDVEFDVRKVEENPELSKDIHETDETNGKQLETKEKATKQDSTKSPERTGWFKFPRFGLSSPSEAAKTSEKDKHKDEKSPVGETVDDEISPTYSVQSSDAFADISSAMTSDVGMSLSSPTKVTVKYSDPNTTTGLGEAHSNIITSTARTELISVEPYLPEKITILSSGVSSSSEDTLRLESGKIHVITSNIQATPEAQHAKLTTAVHVESAGGLPLESEANKAASWTVEDSQGSQRTVFERRLVRETSSERSESKETIVITKQVTRMFDSSEPISGETASSIQRLRDSVHSEKMRFFDGADE